MDESFTGTNDETTNGRKHQYHLNLASNFHSSRQTLISRKFYNTVMHLGRFLRYILASTQ